jgi:hypothetical protein
LAATEARLKEERAELCARLDSAARGGAGAGPSLSAAASSSGGGDGGGDATDWSGGGGGACWPGREAPAPSPQPAADPEPTAQPAAGATPPAAWPDPGARSSGEPPPLADAQCPREPPPRPPPGLDCDAGAAGGAASAAAPRFDPLTEQSEVAEALAANTARVGAALQLHMTLAYAVLTDAQRARLGGVCFPVPCNTGKTTAALAHLLRFAPAALPPAAGADLRRQMAAWVARGAGPRRRWVICPGGGPSGGGPAEDGAGGGWRGGGLPAGGGCGPGPTAAAAAAPAAAAPPSWSAGGSTIDFLTHAS